MACCAGFNAGNRQLSANKTGAANFESLMEDDSGKNSRYTFGIKLVAISKIGLTRVESTNQSGVKVALQ